MAGNVGGRSKPSRPGASRRLLFVTSLCLLSCLYGIVAARCEVFPYTTVRDAVLAARALVDVYTSGTTAEKTDAFLAGPTVRTYARLDDDTLFLMSGGIGCLPERSSTGSTLAWIMDRTGDIKHVWEYEPAIWSHMEWVKKAPFKAEISPIGLHLYDDGGLLVSFHGLHTWPYAVGIARYDRDSRLLWKRELLNHHWFTVADDGRIYVAGMRLLDSPVPIGDTAAQIHSVDGKISDDTVMVLDAEGNVLEEISMLQALTDSGCIGLFQGATHDNIHGFTRDPIHLNDIRLVTAELAERHDWLEEGDLLLSFRSLNTIAVLDRQSKRFKWISSGTAIRQHAPRFWGDSVLVLDNRGGVAKTGGSRLVAIDLATRVPRTVFPKQSVPLPEDCFFTPVAGHIDLSPSHRALVALTEEGDVWEVDLRTGELLWRYTHVDPSTRTRYPIYTAKYVNEVRFPMNQVREATP